MEKEGTFDTICTLPFEAEEESKDALTLNDSNEGTFKVKILSI